jgi:hypothetical protein
VVLLFGHVVTAKELWLFAMFQRMAKQAAKRAVAWVPGGDLAPAASELAALLLTL